MKVSNLVFFTIVFLVSFNSCTYPVRLYTGPELPSREIAKLHCGSEVRIHAFDGGEFILQGESPKYFEILPGHHSVTVVYLGSGRGEYKYGVNPITLKFDAKPGHKYRIECDVHWLNEKEGRWQAWIEDKTTGEIIGK